MLGNNSVTFWGAWDKLGVHEGASGLEERLSRLRGRLHWREQVSRPMLILGTPGVMGVHTVGSHT
jgi:hypothetical protein